MRSFFSRFFAILFLIISAIAIAAARLSTATSSGMLCVAGPDGSDSTPVSAGASVALIFRRIIPVIKANRVGFFLLSFPLCHHFCRQGAIAPADHLYVHQISRPVIVEAFGAVRILGNAVLIRSDLSIGDGAEGNRAAPVRVFTVSMGSGAFFVTASRVTL